MTTKIIMDSTTDLPQEIVDKYDIDIIPLSILIKEETFLDKVTIDVEDVYDIMRQGIQPKTSLPNPGKTYELFEKYASEGRDFIYYSFSSRMSSTFQTCKLIIDELKERYKNVKMKAVDSLGGSFATGLIVWQAAAMSYANYSFEEILDISEDNIRNIEHVFTIDDLNWLLKGGRVSRSGALIGNVLNIKPVLDVQDGQIILIDKVRGRKRALKRVVDLVEERINDFKEQIIGIVHADDFKTALLVKDMIIERLGFDNIFIEKIGSVLATHLGIGGVGVFFLNKKPATYIADSI